MLEFKHIVEYVTIFILFSIFGYLYETILLNKHDTNNIFNNKIQILPLYGFCVVILIFIYKNVSGSLLSKILIASIVINLIECLSGLLSYKFYGFQTWNYGKKMFPFCHGYISLVTIIWWSFLISVFYLILEQLKNCLLFIHNKNRNMS